MQVVCSWLCAPRPSRQFPNRDPSLRCLGSEENKPGGTFPLWSLWQAMPRILFLESEESDDRWRPYGQHSKWRIAACDTRYSYRPCFLGGGCRLPAYSLDRHDRPGSAADNSRLSP